MPELSIVVINDGAEEYCKAFFQSLQHQNYDMSSVEVILIDNCSEDRSVKIAKKYKLDALYVFDTRVDYRALLYKQGIKMSSAAYILFIHSDIYFKHDFLLKVMETLNEDRYDFINFNLKYPDLNDYGYDCISFNLKTGDLYQRRCYQGDVDGSIIGKCSESCFVVRKDLIFNEEFDEDFYDSFFTYIPLFNSDIKIQYEDSISVVHYFLEEHNKIKTEEIDKAIFVAKYYPELVEKLFPEELVPTINGLLHLSLAGLKARASRLEGEKIKSLESELRRVISSRSWRITTPLRSIGNVFRDVWNGIPQSIRTNGKRAIIEEDAYSQTDNVSNDDADTVFNKKSISVESPPFFGKRILLVSYYCPSRAHAGGLRILDIYDLIKRVCPNVKIDVYTHRRPEIDWSYEDTEKVFDNIYYSSAENLTYKGFKQLNKASFYYDIIDLQFHQAACDIKSWRKIGSKIIFTPMESLLRVGLIALGGRAILSARKMRQHLLAAGEELKFCKRADEVVCVSKKDASSLRMFCHASKICALETAVSEIEFTDAFDLKNEEIVPETKKPIILYIAYFGSETNVIALKWYLKVVHPLVRVKVPEYRLQVVGRGDLSDFKKCQYHSVDFIGEVSKLAPYIRNAKVGIAPALNGSGFRGKINQYALYGVPVVASVLAARGFEYQNGKDIFVADQGNLFSQQCIRLLLEDDLNRDMGRKARDCVFTHYTWDSRIDEVKRIYNLEEKQ